MKVQYPNADKEVDAYNLDPLIEETLITASMDSDYAQNLVTWRSNINLIILLKTMLVFFQSKQQGKISTITYDVTLRALDIDVEDIQAVRYMLSCLRLR